MMKRIKPPTGPLTKFLLASAIGFIFLLIYNADRRTSARPDTDFANDLAQGLKLSPPTDQARSTGWHKVEDGLHIPAAWRIREETKSSAYYSTLGGRVACQLERSRVSDNPGLTAATLFDAVPSEMRESGIYMAQLANEQLGIKIPASKIKVDVDIHEDSRPDIGPWSLIVNTTTTINSQTLRTAFSISVLGDARADVTCGGRGVSSKNLHDSIKNFGWVVKNS